MSSHPSVEIQESKMELHPSQIISLASSTSSIETSTRHTKDLQTPEINKVGQSVFYDCIDLSPAAEKQDVMKPERSDTDEESMTSE